MIIKESNVRVSSAIKLLVKTAETQKGTAFENLKKEFLQTATLSSDTFELSKASQEYAWSKKHLSKNYRWY